MNYDQILEILFLGLYLFNFCYWIFLELRKRQNKKSGYSYTSYLKEVKGFLSVCIIAFSLMWVVFYFLFKIFTEPTSSDKTFVLVGMILLIPVLSYYKSNIAYNEHYIIVLGKKIQISDIQLIESNNKHYLESKTIKKLKINKEDFEELSDVFND